MSACPVGCGRSVGLGNLLCRPCWHVVPPPLQAEVWRTWRAWKKDLGSREARAAYQAAADAAIAAVKERVKQKPFDAAQDREMFSEGGVSSV